MSSTTAGYIRPSAEITAPVEDTAFDIILQHAVVGMVGLAGSLVRPRFQQVAPTEPEVGTDWAAIGVLSQKPEGNAYVVHHPTGAVDNTEETGDFKGGWDEMQRHEVVEIMASFYGPNSRSNAHLLRDGLYLEQNFKMLEAQGFGLIDVADVVMAPELINQQWRKRADLRFRLYRLTKRSYPVRNLQEASGTVTSDEPAYTVPWDTDNVKEE